MNFEAGDKSEADLDIIGQRGGRCVKDLCIFGIL